MIGHPDHDAADEIERDDDECGNRIALDEFSGAVHRSVKIRFALHQFAFGTRAFGIEDAGVNVGVDRHLFSRHSVQRKAGGDFSHPLRTRGDDDELNCDQNCEYDQADDEISPHDEFSEGRDDRTGSSGLVALREDEPRCRNIERKAKQRCDEQRRSERRELQRLFDRYAQQQNQRRSANIDAQQRIEQQRRQRHDQDRNDAQQHGGKNVRRDAFHGAMLKQERCEIISLGLSRRELGDDFGDRDVGFERNELAGLSALI